MSSFSGNAVYNEGPRRRYPMTLTRAASSLGITIQRLSRYLKYLQVPVIREGYSVLIDADGYKRIKRALQRNEIKRGRKKKTS